MIKNYIKYSAAAALLLTQVISTNASAEVMLGAYIPKDGFSRQNIANFNDVVPKKLAYINVFSAFNHNWNNLFWQSSNVVSEGAIPMISWMPIDWKRRDDNLLPEIAAGEWDDYLDLWGTKLHAWIRMYPISERPRVAIRFGHEFNGNWYPYSNDPVNYVLAWQHIHDKFEDMGINGYIDWIWSASRTNVDSYNNFHVYYPGDEYVDWTSLDGYNWGSNHTFTSWTSFKNIFTNAYLEMVNNYPDKPILIAETGSAEPSDIPNTYWGMYGDNSDAMESKSDWIANMLTDIENEFPAIRAITLFDINKELGWSIIGEANTGLSSWITGIQSNHYTSDYLIASQISMVDETEVAMDSPVELASSSSSSSSTTTTLLRSSNKNVTARTRSKSKFNAAQVDKALKESELLYISNMERKELTKQKKLDKKEQSKLAKSKKPIKVDPTEEFILSLGLRYMSSKSKDKLKESKTSVIDY